MTRRTYEVVHVIEQFSKQFVAQYQPNSYHRRVLNALSQCRTSELGGHVQACDSCGQTRISYNSCRNRHCPKCQASKQAFWVDDLLQATLPVKHYHIVFTLPHELNQIAMLDNAAFYNQLFAAVWDTLRTFGYTRFGVETGAVCVLHTWGQNLSLHPHVHCIVPATGLSLAGNLKDIGAGGKYLYPVRQLSTVFRGKFLDTTKRRLRKLGVFVKYQQIIDSAWQKPWVVFCEPSLAKPEHVIKYLGQYTHRVAISNDRLIGMNDKEVTFLHKDYADNAIKKPITLDGVEFLRRFCMHILPLRFVKIRRYGIYSSRQRAQQLKANPKMRIKTAETTQQRLLRLTGVDVYLCPVCKKGTLCQIEELPRVRSPTSFYAILSNPSL